LGVTAERVQSLVPDVAVRMRDASFERAAWEEVLQTINGYTPFLESGSPGFAFFRPPDALEDTKALAEALDARIGVGPNRSVSLLASLKPAPGTVLPVAIRYVPSFLDRYPIDRLRMLGFGETFVEQMGLFGYGTLGKAQTLSLRHLKAQFGEEGERLHGLLHPDEPDKPVGLYRPSPAITTVYEFEHPVSEPGDLLPALDYLTERASARLGDQRCQRIKVSLQCSSPSETRFACRTLPEPVATPRRIMHTARTLVMNLLHRSLQVETLTLELSALRRPEAEQASLFARRPALTRAVQAVHRRFPEALKRPVVRDHAIFPEDRTGMEGMG
jgi:nucleotidyltransferase/DNA polymerase involved in DNA repair